MKTITLANGKFDNFLPEAEGTAQVKVRPYATTLWPSHRWLRLGVQVLSVGPSTGGADSKGFYPQCVISIYQLHEALSIPFANINSTTLQMS